METEIRKLYTCMGLQTESYDELLALARDKQEKIVHNDLEGLTGIMEREKELVLLLHNLENDRLKLVGVLGDSLGLQGNPPSVTDLLAKIDGDLKQEGEGLVNRLSDLLTELSELNRTNGQLLEQSLRFVEYSLQIFTEGQKMAQSYGRDGKLPGDNQKVNVLDRKA